MWVVAIIAIIAILLAVATAPKPNVENARAAALGDFQVPRAKYGDPKGLLWGTCRAKSPVTLWIGDYNPVPIKQKVPSGLFSSKKVITGYKYYVGLDLAWCLGGRPGNTVKLKRLWAGKHQIYSGDLAADSTFVINMPNLFGGEKERGGLQGTVAFYNGGFNPAQDSYLLSKCHPEVPAYNGVCRTVFRAFYFGTSPNIETLNAELSRMTNNLSVPYSIMPNGLDVNPMEILYDAITEKWGRFGASQEDIDLPSWQAAAQALYNEGNGMSLFVQSGITGKQLAEEVLRQADGILYQDPSTAKICVSLTRNNYDPNTLDIIDESMVLELKEFSKTTWEATLNQCRVTFKDRSQDYNESVAVAQDFALINYQQRVKNTDLSMPGCMTSELANALAARQLGFVSVPLFKLELVCNRKASNLRPGMVRRFNWAPYGLSNLVIRILRVDLGELEDGSVRLTCIQDRFATTSPVFAPPDDSQYQPGSASAAPVAIRRMWEPPYFLARNAAINGAVPPGSTGLYALANKPGNQSVRFDVQVSTDSFVTYTTGLEDAPYNGSGLLATIYPASAGATTGLDAAGFSVNTLSGAEGLASFALADARDGRALLLVDDELMLYTGVSVVGGVATFTNVYRGVLGTQRADHAMGARVWFVSESDGLLEMLFTNGSGPKTRLIDYTPSSTLEDSAGLQDTIAFTGVSDKPVAPRYLQLNGSRTPATTVGATSVTADWRGTNRLRDTIAIYSDPSEATESGTDYVLRWRVGAGSYTTISGIAGLTQNINVTGLTGTLEVRVSARRNGLQSVEDFLTMTLT